MTNNWLRRTAVLAACASAAVLVACGSSTVDSAITPTRIVSFGDAFSDLGQSGVRYTINDGSVNIWTQQFAQNYGRTITSVAAGGTSYARGNARVLGSPARALHWAERLRSRGIEVQAIRPPTVPPGTARIRLTVTAAHGAADIDRAIEAFAAAVRADASEPAEP